MHEFHTQKMVHGKMKVIKIQAFIGCENKPSESELVKNIWLLEMSILV